MVFMQVFAVGNMGVEWSPPSCMNSTDGRGENPTGGTIVSPVAKVKIFCSFFGSSSSEKRNSMTVFKFYKAMKNGINVCGCL